MQATLTTPIANASVAQVIIQSMTLDLVGGGLVLQVVELDGSGNQLANRTRIIPAATVAAAYAAAPTGATMQAAIQAFVLSALAAFYGAATVTTGVST